jgi:acyl-CoA synthetase (AMP-forming)/AMP-acid ligase II
MAAPAPAAPDPAAPDPAAPEQAVQEPAVPQPTPAAAYESVAAVIRARAAADPAAIAITGDGRQLTFGELDERSSRLASALAGLGVRRSDRVAYLDQNATEFWETMLDLMQAHGTTHAALIPAIIQVMVELPQARTADFSSLRTVVYGASPIDPGLLRRAVDLFRAEFTQTYGLTETVGVATLLRPDDHRSADPARLRSAGRAAACAQIAVTDPATGAMLPGGWLRTGDAGHLDADGYLTIADRIKDIIISGGENIIPGEVERVLAEHDGVLEAAVIGVPSPRWGETPTRVEWVDALPRNPSGKVLRRKLRAPYWQHLDRQVG